MEIRRWHCYLAINCALIIPLLSAKPFSLNEAIAAESKLQKTHTTPPIPKETNTRFSLNKQLPSEPVHKSRKFKSDKHFSSPLKLDKFPSLKSRKFSEIASQLKSKRLSDLLRPLYKRKRQSKKREIFKNDKIDDKYFPLFKNLGLLFDNLLDESGDSYESTKKKNKRRKDSDEKRGIVCSCAVQSDAEPSESRPRKKTIVPAKNIFTTPESPLASEKSTAAPTTTDTTLGNFGSFRQNKDLPTIFSRDTSGGRGNDNGHGERGRTTFHGSSERDITRNIRNRKYLARNKKYEFSAEYDEEDTDSYSRNGATRDEPRRGGDRGNINDSLEGEATLPSGFPKTKKANGNLRGHVYGLPRENKLKTRRNETESEEFIPQHIRGVRGPLSENKIDVITESVQSKENYEEGYLGVPLHHASDKRLVDGDGASAGENQEVRPGDETVISINDMSNLDLALHKEPKFKPPSVSIIDGYSVARDKNGQNKLTEKTIRIHV